MGESALGNLKRVVGGVVVEPGDPGYDEARRVWNVRFDRRPDVVVRSREPADVVAAIAYARQNGLPLSVKGGGHSYAANTVVDGGVLIDTSPMKGVRVNPSARTVQVEAGTTWRDVDKATQEHGLATPGPTVSSVGVAGSTLGGGNGYLSRRFGMSIDNLLSAEVATADGRLVRAAADENPDLFWAIRGGGGNLGVVTSFEFQLHPVGPTVLAGQILHRFADAESVLRLYRDFMVRASDEIQCYAFVLRVPPISVFPVEFHGELAIDLVVFHTDPAAADAFQPLLDFGAPILAHVSAQAYVTVQQSFDAGLPSGQRYESRSHDLDELSDEAIGTFIAQVGNLPGKFTVAYFSENRGATARVASEATAFAHRHAAYSWHVLAGWTDANHDGEVTTWAQSFHDAMASHATGGVYVNLLGTGEEDRVRSAYGNNYDRLAALKGQWDPQNVFRVNHNIEPA